MLLKLRQHLLRTAAQAGTILTNGDQPPLGSIRWDLCGGISHSDKRTERHQDRSNLTSLPGGWRENS
jgi:hypothetical protein